MGQKVVLLSKILVIGKRMEAVFASEKVRILSENSYFGKSGRRFSVSRKVPLKS